MFGFGNYDTQLEAALAYDAEAKRRRGKKARLNFPDEAPPKDPHSINLFDARSR